MLQSRPVAGAVESAEVVVLSVAVSLAVLELSQLAPAEKKLT